MSRTSFELIPRTKLRDGVLRQLRDALDRGTYGPGDELPSERELMLRMGVGRPAVREAMIALEQQGRIAIAHGRRARVLDPASSPGGTLGQPLGKVTADMLMHAAISIDELNEARLLFEREVVRLAAERVTPAGIALLKRGLQANRRAISDANEYLATDMALHRTIAKIANNTLCAAVGDALFRWLPRFHVKLVHVEGANLLSHDEHARIVERIAAHDPEGAVRAIETHIRRSHSLYQKLGADPSASTAPVTAGKARIRRRMR
jgi:GntR family transcriptional regulator, sialic acid-inducible nan operon repressor